MKYLIEVKFWFNTLRENFQQESKASNIGRKKAEKSDIFILSVYTIKYIYIIYLYIYQI